MAFEETPFKIDISDEKLAALQQKLNCATLPDELEEADWEYGVPLSDVKRLLARWTSGYDWRAHEKALNVELPQFTRDIEVDGFGKLNIHYVHKKSTVKDAIPLLFVHGWPGSFLEVRKILPLLTAASPDHPSFHVVTFSLPGYGFSEAPRKKKFVPAQYAEIGNKLMLALGYNEYVTQGGDWGYMITRKIAQLYGEKHSKAWHTNQPLAKPPSFWKNPLGFLALFLVPFTAEEKGYFARTSFFQQKKGNGYYVEQATQPQTLGYSLADSPIGLLAWIYEKLILWTDDYKWDDDEVLTWISVYWFSRAGPAASIRIYFETMQNTPGVLQNEVNPTIPMGVSFFPKEVAILPERWVKDTGKLVFTNKHHKGGHFAAHEVPELLVSDVRKMFGKDGPAYGVVPWKDGYERLGRNTSGDWKDGYSTV